MVGATWRGVGAAARRLAVASAASTLLLVGPVAGQQARDPLAGQFGALEVALAPAEALRQAELMADALRGLAPQRPGVTDVYVLAAGFWSDPVFEREASKAAGVLAQHFSAEGRTLVLSAGTGSGVRAYPAASPNNLSAAIGRIGQLIDPAEDLVVLFLTSHGGQDGSIGIQEKNRMGGALKPAHLRAALASAGIRNRVLIVSACFSGVFIPAFSDAGSVVLTAAAADKQSFGCEPNNEWTWFGDALFNHALKDGEATLVEAYGAALKLIARWEAEKLLDPSNPQMHVGEGAAALLAKVEG